MNNILLIYDISEDRLRIKVSEMCKDYGLVRVQYSAFFGELSLNLRGELERRLKELLKKSERSSIFMFPLSEDCLNRVIQIDIRYSELSV